ncbi:hypothetical protein [Sphaerisporangium perillae]|uniref:hypothetical protein n=1 Tax=Sphaerisporangium perillae TaxID=2935860 RepID=UPI00200E0AA9|nr:hypothetical protein [Sphaerisporangium perillae]
MLSWSVAMGYGAIGGLIVEAVALWNHLSAWRDARHTAGTKRKRRPRIGEFIDPAADTAVALTRAALGCAAGALLHSQITGSYAAVAVGAAAPALLTTFGKAAAQRSGKDGGPQNVEGPE